MRLPPGYQIWELRGKRGRKHVVVFRCIVPAYGGFRFRPPYIINGPVRWYAGRSKRAMKPLTGWLKYW